MSITPGFKAKRRLLQMALKPTNLAKGVNYIAGGETPLAMQTKGLTVQPWQSEQISRDLDDGKSGAQQVVHFGEMITISGAVEMAGSGTANTAAPWAPLVEMSGYDVNKSVGTEVSHNRILAAADEADATMYFLWEGMYHILLAGKCSLSISGNVGELGMINFEAKGIYGGTVAGAIPTATFGAWIQPVPFSQQNTSFSLDGQLFNTIGYEMAQNNTIEYDEGTELKQIFIDDWAEEGKVIIEQPTLSTFDPFAIARSSALVPFEFTHGINAGNIFKQSAASSQILTVTPGVHKGKSTWELAIRVIRGSDSIITTR